MREGGNELHQNLAIADFSLIDSDGDVAGAWSEGLLISNGGTVCDDYFTDDTADAICRKMGHFKHLSWSSGNKWDIQSERDIKLDNVKCENGYWDSCLFSTKHNCVHSEDVFLKCRIICEFAIYIFILIFILTQHFS